MYFFRSKDKVRFYLIVPDLNVRTVFVGFYLVYFIYFIVKSIITRSQLFSVSSDSLPFIHHPEILKESNDGTLKRPISRLFLFTLPHITCRTQLSTSTIRFLWFHGVRTSRLTNLTSKRSVSRLDDSYVGSPMTSPVFTLFSSTQTFFFSRAFSFPLALTVSEPRPLSFVHCNPSYRKNLFTEKFGKRVKF